MSTAMEELERIAPHLVNDILAEIGEKNTVRVFVTRGNKKELVSDSRVDPTKFACTPAMLLQQDRLRVSHGLKPLYTKEMVRRQGHELIGFNRNLRVNTGINYVSTQLGGTAATAVAKYIAVSNNTNAPAALNTTANTTATRICWGTDTTSDAAASTSRGEYSVLGFARALATYAHTTDVTSYTQTVTFTATGAATNLQCCGIFDNATKQAGTLFCENTYTATTFATTDQLTIAWTFNI